MSVPGIASELCSLANEVASHAEYERGALTMLRRVLPFDVGFFVRADGVGPGRLGLDPSVVEASATKWPRFGRELAPVFARATGDGLAVDTDVLGDRFRATTLYRDFVAPHQGECTVLAPLRVRGRHLATLAIGRCAGTFGARELQGLRALLPALRVCESSFHHAPGPYPVALSPREHDVLDLLRLGYTNREIARALGTSVNTVRNQLRSLFRKLGATTRAEAVALSLGHGDR
ncbi:MAG TPA: helix-turn-helix transcriptional regulator [Sandaracinaceae bacterium LLY-WYZ-13_1]|nr:helix-turn-helix transcriptional regulator [Sandaracinaceae bacterium LLY-WYZ-13_1]